jgi:2-polyprenyl-3-methyl-5-hydroxy-6-metoxy-1,4-benzoquinol methylase
MAGAQIVGPFGPATHVEAFPTRSIVEMYKAKCGFDVGPHFGELDKIDLFECTVTGYRFWRPEHVAGDESFYRDLNAALPDYYADWRWEYGPMLSFLRSSDRLLEVGAGQGFFLKLTEGRISFAMGLELNLAAISAKVTANEIRADTIEQYAKNARLTLDVVCSFQVLEHVSNPATFIESCIESVKPGGMIAFSTPNINHRVFARRENAFDLPPHHVGHFSPSVYRQLAKYYGLTIQNIIEEPRFVVDGRTPAVLSLAKRLLNGAYRAVYGPGACVLVIYRKT